MHDSKEILDSATAWDILGRRRKARVGSTGDVEDGKACTRIRASEQQGRLKEGENVDVDDVYLKYMEKMNKHVSLQSVADKAAESWKSSKTKLNLTEASNLPPRPSEELFDFLVSADTERHRTESPTCHSSDTCSDFGNNKLTLIRETSNTSAVSQADSPAECASPKSHRARKRNSITMADSPPCARHSGRRRRFSRTDKSPEPDCTCRSRRRSSLLFNQTAPTPLLAAAASISGCTLPSEGLASSPCLLRSQSLSSGPKQRRSFSTTQLSLFAQDLNTIAAQIPAGDPRIGELYGAAARAFGPPSFIPAKRAGSGSGERLDSTGSADSHPAYCSQ